MRRIVHRWGLAVATGLFACLLACETPGPPESESGSWAGRLGWDGVITVAPAEPDEREEGAAPHVRDLRHFARLPRSLRRPSLPGGLERRAEARGRALGRRRNGRGGVLWLPAGDSVEALAVRVVTSALAATSDTSTPVDERFEIEIESLWAWHRPLPRSPDLFESEWVLRIRGPVAGLEHGFRACGKGRVARDAGGRGVWTRALMLGFEDIARDLRERLRSPQWQPPSWRCPPRDGAPGPPPAASNAAVPARAPREPGSWERSDVEPRYCGGPSRHAPSAWGTRRSRSVS
ncbi:MAG: hypothetical protein ACQGVK_06895 [Myxococcota bacterium]